jgi:hypothetical protein
MADRARVYSSEALRDIKAALLEFTEAVNLVLTSVDADINRMSHWLSHDRPGHWKREVRKREDQVQEAHGAVMRKRIISAPEPASVVEEQKALQKTKQRLADAQIKLGNVRRWAPTFEREALLYKGSVRGLAEMLHRDIPAAISRLDRMVASLEAYERVAPPRAEIEGAVSPETAESAEVESEGAPPAERPPGEGRP